MLEIPASDPFHRSHVASAHLQLEEAPKLEGEQGTKRRAGVPHTPWLVRFHNLKKPSTELKKKVLSENNVFHFLKELKPLK